MIFVLMFVTILINGCLLVKCKGRTKFETISARVFGWMVIIGWILAVLYAFGSVE